ncbi:TonB-dependent receptor [Curvibacter sp. HBC28]|uniref:TonB-dependent receptor n=1 Tax=Curvibacter microcysteis TaxID=3026419 RepID=A0ABT5MKC0_9BURK|nr:TonB-dependent receptor [Curvibacter sp. HBC28]MDD0817032.1 TonB-dependent receptor [Curvibacter sp. HBC28]
MLPPPPHRARVVHARFNPRAALAALLCWGGGVVCAQTLSDVVVSASRSEQKAMDTAASISLIQQDQIQEGQAQAHLSEALVRVPGVSALNRHNHAQDLQISVRGFGANSTFGARGLRILVDGIPGTVADGQGQISHIDLASAARIEVLRGPFSTLYGNASGGVIQVFTEQGQAGQQLTPYQETGSYGFDKGGIKASGEQDGINYLLDAGRLHSDGFRQHSAATRSNGNAKLKLDLGRGTQVQLVANTVSLNAQDPLGLTRTQWQQNERQAGHNALAYDTRKSVHQTQYGLVLTQQVDGLNTVVISPYYGERRTTQFLAGSAASGATPASNGVIKLSRTFYGVDAHWRHQDQLAGGPWHWVAGLDTNRNSDRRLTANNMAGIALPTAASHQDLRQYASNLDGYLQTEWRPEPRSTLGAGLRQSHTELGSTSSNAQPGSGQSRYNATTGLLSAQHHVRDDTHVYLAFGTGWDTPTLNQVAYNPATLLNSGVPNAGNFGLQAARTRQWELGLKSELADGARVQAAWFDARTRNDLVIGVSNGGRTAFTNTPQTSRQGLEFSAHVDLLRQLQLNSALTLMRATVDTPYTSYAGSSPVTIAAGRRIPGVAGRSLYTELLWQRADKAWEFAIEGRAVGNMAGNDANTAWASGYGWLNARWLTRQQLGPCLVTGFVRVDNLLNRSYVGSMIVNQANSQFYEPAPGRQWLLGVKALWRY